MESHRVPAVGFTPPVDSSDEAKPTTRRPREPRTRPFSTDRHTTPPFVTPPLQTIYPRWRRSPTEPRAAAVRRAPEI
ncbi:hypothetical protein HID58_046207 [Brassica napus]|uniref:Uncharacterized protein n=1 Tax=Brassica napus TaxID=3708 RepID=A0ABQ8AVW3_BRANA|nr:hypothetical protein HID58_046207 [Brassica napus]